MDAAPAVAEAKSERPPPTAAGASASPAAVAAQRVVRSQTIEAGEGADPESNAEDCEERRQEIKDRLDRIVPLPPCGAALEKLDVELPQLHRDFFLKEMAWMALDFATERQRHANLLKKRSKMIQTHFKGMDGRRKKRRRDEDAALRQLARKCSRAVKHFWLKIDKFVAYKRRLEWQTTQRKAMDKQLVHLVKQTERYTDELATKLTKEEEDRDDDARAVDDAKNDAPKPCARGKRRAPPPPPPKEKKKKAANGKASEANGGNGNANGKSHKRKVRGEAAPAAEAAAKEAEEVGVQEDAATRLEKSDAAARSRDVARPYLLDPRLSLRPYQQAGLNWLVSMHARRLNGILADEMGLGKTVQTIALLAHLAAQRGIWGPHLVVVPTSCLVNWEGEMKKFCPGLKICTYYGAAKTRRALRAGWSKPDAFHVCITSYQLAVQDASAFRRKKFYYLILDEAHNIKNFESKRWQTLLAFQAQRRLLITGTPLQNSLMELWSLMHFLMPHVFRSRSEFSYWFSNPLTSAVEGKSKVSDELVRRLHAIMRPFVLRRLKRDVEKQLPGKFEHDVKCKLSRRQQLLYEEFMSRSTTRQAVQAKAAGGANVMSMMNVVMQLRKVCNHPDLFEPRPVVAPLVLETLVLRTAALAASGTGAFEGLGAMRSTGGAPGTAAFWRILDESGWDSLDVRLFDGLCCNAKLRQGLAAARAARSSLFVDDVHVAPAWSDAAPAPMDVDGGPSRPAAFGPSDGARTDGAPPDVRFDGDVSMEDVRLEMRVFAAEARLQRADASDRELARGPGAAPGWRARRCLLAMLAQTPLRAAAAAANDADLKRRNAARLESPDSLRDLAESSSVEARVEQFTEVIKRFVFCVPRAVAATPELAFAASHAATKVRLARQSRRRSAEASTRLAAAAADESESLAVPRRRVELEATVQGRFGSFAVAAARLELSRLAAPLRPLELRLTVGFPDRSLVQWDSGKFHTLAPLLREKKRGGHRCLIFTQMSRMLDVLESFLSLHGHSYVRLDGGTKPEERQRLMDRFNTDTQIFCFVLSTRSGGLGINLTGADTVIFYDSDWNPSMDAQAMDRAHRIGQTRDVHIYRLVCSATVEENILLKARQKQKLEFVALTEGNFDSEHLEAALQSSKRDQLEAAMSQLEDADDAAGAKAAALEAETQANEFDENALAPPADDDDGDEPKEAKEVDELAEAQEDEDEAQRLEAEFAAWQQRVGPDPTALCASLSKVEQRCLARREDETAGFGAYFLTPQEKKLFDEQAANRDEHWDVDAIEAQKANDEAKALESGDLIATELYFATAGNAAPAPSFADYALDYGKRRRRANSAKARRRSTGAAWEERVDGASSQQFWYNVDTGEATWLAPRVIQRRDADAAFRAGGFADWPHDVAAAVVQLLAPAPDRARAASVCRSWMRACADERLLLKVVPVERLSEDEDARRRKESAKALEAQQGTRRSRLADGDAEMADASDDDERLSPGFQRTRCYSVRCALRRAQRGETIVLAPGHYWEEAADLVVDRAVRIVGDASEPARVVLELGGALKWRATGGALIGVTIRRPRKSDHATAAVFVSGTLGARRVFVDNDGAGGAAVVVQEGGFAYIERSTIQSAACSAILVKPGAKAGVRMCDLRRNRHALLASASATALISDSDLRENTRHAIVALAGSAVGVRRSDCSGYTEAQPAVYRDSGIKFSSKANVALPDSGPPRKAQTPTVKAPTVKAPTVKAEPAAVAAADADAAKAPTKKKPRKKKTPAPPPIAADAAAATEPRRETGGS